MCQLKLCMNYALQNERSEKNSGEMSKKVSWCQSDLHLASGLFSYHFTQPARTNSVLWSICLFYKHLRNAELVSTNFAR